MNKIKVLISGIIYPLAMLSYFVRAFERREDVELWLAGPFTGDFIPWNGGMHLPQRYVRFPDCPLNQRLVGQPISSKAARPPWKPNLWLQIDAGFHFVDKPDADCVAHVATDPHCLSATYKEPRRYADVFFNMQTPYMEKGDVYLPYAFDPTIHYPMPLEKKFDACLIGLHYPQRTTLVNMLRECGMNVYYDIGKVFDEYRELYNQSRVALSWSSMEDLPTRVFEAMGMGIPLVTNVVPDLHNWFTEGEHYLGFSNALEGRNKVQTLLKDEEFAQWMAGNAYRKVKAGHTWDHRVAQILETCKLI